MTTIYIPRYLFINGKFVENMAVAVENGVIIGTEKTEELTANFPQAEKILWKEMALVPGTVNTHNHSFQSLLRGLSADRPFLEWRNNSLYHFSPKMREEDIYTGAVFAFSEMLKCGVTTVCDFFYLHNDGTAGDEAIVLAAHDTGIRLVLARTMYDWDGAPKGYVETIEQALSNTRNLAKKYEGNDMVSVLPAPHSLHGASPEMIIEGHKLAKELNTCFHLHVAEEPFEVEFIKRTHEGLRTLEYLDKLGVVDERMVIIHGVWLDDKEVELLGARGGKLAYCPSSNMFLADGVTNIPHMLKAGVDVALGTDGACSNNRISVFEEMRMVSLLQKVTTRDAMCIDYTKAFAMGTENGARILGIPTGRIENGLKADFVGIDTHDFSMQPISRSMEQILPNIVYSMQPTAIKEVVVNGCHIVGDGKLLSISEKNIVELVEKTMAHLGS